MYEYELEALPELEWEYEGEYEDEAEAFFGRLANLAQRAAQSPALRRIGLTAARMALRGLSDASGAVGGRLGGQQGGALGRQFGAQAGHYLDGLLPQHEYEGEFEGEYEDEYEANPIARIYPDVLMEHLGHAAAEAESEAEAEAFIGALIPLAVRLIPQAAPTIMQAAPGLVRGLANTARTLRSSPTTRPLLRTLPTVVSRTAASIARQTAQGRRVTPDKAVRTLAQQTAQVISSPQQATHAYQRSAQLDRQYHRASKTPSTPPVRCEQCGH
ncbi:MAG: hypothetical protein U0350_23365 [Caldilineaceae bacterium]